MAAEKEKAMRKLKEEVEACDSAIERQRNRKAAVKKDCDAEILRQRQHKKQCLRKIKVLDQELQVLNPMERTHDFLREHYPFFTAQDLTPWAKWTIDTLYARALDDEDWKMELQKCVPKKSTDDYIYVDDVPQGIPGDMQHLSDFITHVLRDLSEQCPILQPWDHKLNENVQTTWGVWMQKCPFLRPLEELLQFKEIEHDDDDTGRDICRRFPRDSWPTVAVIARKWIDNKTFPNWKLFAAALLQKMRDWTPDDE